MASGPGATFETRTVDTARGTFRAGRTGSGPDLLVLHTLRNQLEYAYLIAPGLSRAFTVHAIDLPGHGQSAHDLDRPYEPERFFGDVQAYIESLDLHDLTLVGESIGATTSLVLGARIPGRLGGVYAFNPHDRTPMLGGGLGGVLSRLGSRTTIPWKMERPAILRRVLSAAFADPSHLPDEYLALLVESGAHPSYPGIMESVMANQGKWPDAREAYGQIPRSLPVTIVYGDHDWAAPSHREESAALVPGVAGHITLEETGHWSFLDSPDAVVDIVLAGS